MVDESSHRKEDFNEDWSVPIVLSDGQTWYFPRPFLALTPVFENGKADDAWKFYSYNSEIDSLLDRIGQSDDIRFTMLAAVSLGALLLRRNYELSDAELSQIFVYRYPDKSSNEMLRQIIDTATGGLFSYAGRGVLDDPKLQSAGSESH